MTKYNLYIYLLVLLGVITLASCKKSSSDTTPSITEVPPIEVEIYLYNSTGENLLDDSLEGNLLGCNIVMTHQGISYALGEVIDDEAYIPTFTGLQLCVNSETGEPYMTFGQLEASEKYTDSMILKPNNGDSYYEITLEMEPQPDNELLYLPAYSVNSKKINQSIITITTNEYIEEPSFDVDFYPVNIMIRIINAEWENLLEEQVEDNILSNSISLTYNGTKYNLDEELQSVASKAYLTTFYGLMLYYAGAAYGNILYFGEFDGSDDYDMSMQLDLGTGQTYDLHYFQDIEYDATTGKSTSDIQCSIDGVIQELKYFQITL